MNILLADDEPPKLENVAAVVTQLLPTASLATARSVRAAIRMLRSSPFDLLLLDMSLPTFDVMPGEPGGRGQGSGGVEVLRYMRFYGIRCPVIVVTQYEAFSEQGSFETLSDMSIRLRAEHGNGFGGIVYYGSAGDGWEHTLMGRMKDVLDLPA